jgi:hypothetical protein
MERYIPTANTYIFQPEKQWLERKQCAEDKKYFSSVYI